MMHRQASSRARRPRPAVNPSAHAAPPLLDATNVKGRDDSFVKSPHPSDPPLLPLIGNVSDGGQLNKKYVKIRRKWRLLRYPLATFLLLAIFVVLAFGTIYSNMTSRDPCTVQEKMTRTTTQQPLYMPRLFHYQSKTSDMTNEIQTWRTVLNIVTASQEYPNIVVAAAAVADSEESVSTTNEKKEKESWTAVYWSDESCLKLVKEEFPTFADTYHNFHHNIQRVDSCRYLILSKYGGIYSDTDVSLHARNANELEQLIPNGIGLVESPYRYNEKWQNSLMTATIPNHPFWNVVLSMIVERGSSDQVLSTTGPKMIGDAVDRYYNKKKMSSSSSSSSGKKNGGGGTTRNDDEVEAVEEAVVPVTTLPCELFQRLPTGEWNTTFLNVIGREIIARAIPMRGCGRYGDGRCEITRHVGKASWTINSGIYM